MEIYIAASWRHQHAVEMLTSELRVAGHEVQSFVEYQAQDEENARTGAMAFDEWVWSHDGEQKFLYDTDGATKSDLVIYIGPSGKDAAAEIGAAWGKGVPVYGLHAKGEDFGLMRRMIRWFDSYRELLEAVENDVRAKLPGQEADRA